MSGYRKNLTHLQLVLLLKRFGDVGGLGYSWFFFSAPWPKYRLCRAAATSQSLPTVNWHHFAAPTERTPSRGSASNSVLAFTCLPCRTAGSEIRPWLLIDDSSLFSYSNM